MAKCTLHIVDGESTGGSLRLSGLARSAQILRWKDSLNAGPVPAGLTLQQLSKVRSRFWTGNRTDEFKSRDLTLKRYCDYDEVALWFGYTSLCQLSLVQLLAWFAERKTEISRLSLITAYGGYLTSEQFFNAYRARKPVTPDQMNLAQLVWKGFREPSPLRLCRLMGINLRALPDLRDALWELLQEYPSVHGGLSLFERMLLQSIESHGVAKASIAVANVITRHAVGDVLLFDILRQFITANCPLLCFTTSFAAKLKSYKFNSAELTLTDEGRRILAGEADYIALNGIDRWIGGVHLKGKRVSWRWEEEKHSIVRTKS